MATLYAENPQEWSVDHVYHWAIGEVDINQESAAKLKNRNIDGKALLTSTVEEICQIVPDFSFKLSRAINNLKILFRSLNPDERELIKWLQSVVSSSEDTLSPALNSEGLYL